MDTFSTTTRPTDKPAVATDVQRSRLYLQRHTRATTRQRCDPLSRITRTLFPELVMDHRSPVRAAVHPKRVRATFKSQPDGCTAAIHADDLDSQGTTRISARGNLPALRDDGRLLQERSHREHRRLRHQALRIRRSTNETPTSMPGLSDRI